MSWYLKAVKNYIGFSGRAQRKEYWYFYLFSHLITIAMVIIDFIIYRLSSETVLGMFTGAYLLAVILPKIAVTFRRLHDTGRSAWWWLINLVPIFGNLFYLYFLISDSEPEENQYGSSPKAIISKAVDV